MASDGENERLSLDNFTLNRTVLTAKAQLSQMSRPVTLAEWGNASFTTNGLDRANHILASRRAPESAREGGHE